ncbi:hypothetical protein T484DRAFT_1764159 [Baffinella frigidus]|nr:hypothetical protein T484DRAFT_1764159 [Cryptophyta sp. CCMP2293]
MVTGKAHPGASSSIPRRMWWARRVAISVLVPLASLDLAAAFGPVHPGLGLRASTAVSRCTRPLTLGSSNEAGDGEAQTNTGRFHQIADFDHSGMDHKEFR